MTIGTFIGISLIMIAVSILLSRVDRIYYFLKHNPDLGEQFRRYVDKDRA